MGRRDYIAIAKILSAHRECGSIPDEHDFQFMIDDFCTYFYSDNIRFSRDKFTEACYSRADPMLGRANVEEGDYS